MKEYSGSRDLPCPAGELVPHAEPMLLVQRLLQVADDDDTEDWSIVEAVAPRQGMFIDNGAVSPEYLIELTAQAIAAVDGYKNGDGGSALGFLAGVQNFTWFEAPLAGETLRVEIKKTFALGPVLMFEGAVRAARGALCGSGQLKIWREEQ